jgi:hypothetical protein
MVSQCKAGTKHDAYLAVSEQGVWLASDRDAPPRLLRGVDRRARERSTMTESEDYGVAWPAADPQGLEQASQLVPQRFEQGFQPVMQQIDMRGFQPVMQSIDMRGFHQVMQPIGGQPGSQTAAASPDEPANDSATERHREGQ